MSSIFIPSLATVRKFGGMGHGQVQRRARRTAFGAKWPLKLSGSADLVKILLRITHRKCIVSGFERLVYQNICLILYLFQTSIYFYYVLEEIWVASTIMVLTRPDQPDPPKKRHLKSSFELFMGFWVYQWPTQWLRLGRLVGDARFVNEWRLKLLSQQKHVSWRLWVVFLSCLFGRGGISPPAWGHAKCQQVLERSGLLPMQGGCVWNLNQVSTHVAPGISVFSHPRMVGNGGDRALMTKGL